MSINLVYRLRQLASTKEHQGLLPVSQATIWRWVRDGRFPAPFTMGNRCTVWDADTVNRWLAAQREGSAN